MLFLLEFRHHRRKLVAFGREAQKFVSTNSYPHECVARVEQRG